MTHPLSPTTVLPALASLHACNAARVGEAFQVLRDVYFPHAPSSTAMGIVPALKQSLSEAVPTLRPKRTAYILHHDGVPDSGYASAEEDDLEGGIIETRDEEECEKLNILRSDELERGYVIKWLTGLVKRGDAWVNGMGSSSPSSEEQAARMARLEDASRFLARFAGDDAPEQALTRTFVFPFRLPSCCRCRYSLDLALAAPPITIELNDAPVDRIDHTAVGLQSWGSAIVFAERMCKDPERYLGVLHPCTPISTTTTTITKPKDTRMKTTTRKRRLLELGAGTGLLSITAAQILSRTPVQAKIKATDHHPSVLENLARNVQHNRSAVGVFVDKLDWCAVSRTEGAGVNADVDEDGGVYDVVLAADVVYHPEHARWVRGCVERTLKKGGVFWLIIPVRTIGRHEGLRNTLEEAFPVAGGVGVRACNGELKRGGEGEHLAIVRQEDVERVEGVGRADEGGYTLFEIRWV